MLQMIMEKEVIRIYTHVDADGNQIETAFVLEDANGHQFDIHAIQIDEQGNGIPVWDAPGEFIFMWDDLAGNGLIDGITVQCLPPSSQMIGYTGYELPEKHLVDFEMLHEKFGMAYPAGVLSPKSKKGLRKVTSHQVDKS